MTSDQRCGGKHRQQARSLGHTESDGHVSADLPYSVVVSAGAAHRKIDRDSVFNLPDCSDQTGASYKLANVELIKEFANRPHWPVVRALDNCTDNVIGMPIAGQRRLNVDMYCRPVPLLREDAEQPDAGAELAIPSQERIENVSDDADLEEVYDCERHLLYVACTRARDQLLVTGVKPASEFLGDLAG